MDYCVGPAHDRNHYHFQILMSKTQAYNPFRSIASDDQKARMHIDAERMTRCSPVSIAKQDLIDMYACDIPRLLFEINHLQSVLQEKKRLLNVYQQRIDQLEKNIDIFGRPPQKLKPAPTKLRAISQL